VLGHTKSTAQPESTALFHCPHPRPSAAIPLAPSGTPLDGLSSNYSRPAEARAYAAEPGLALALVMARDAIRQLKIVVHAAPADPDCF
jgi:hypothetical protein